MTISLVWMFVPSQTSYVEVLTPTPLQMMITGGEVFERWLGYKGGALKNGISA